MSKTPRTDAKTQTVQMPISINEWVTVSVVSSEFAKQLEAELAEAREHSTEGFRLAEQKIKELAEAKEQLKHKGLACDKHDLVGGWACPRCLANAKAELAEANERLANQDAECGKLGLALCDALKENAEFKRQVAAGELITPQTIHDFLEMKHDRWNPLYMADLVKFAAEKAKESK